MSKTITQRIHLAQESIRSSHDLLAAAIESNDQDIAAINCTSLIDDYLTIGLLSWRQKKDPSFFLTNIVECINLVLPTLKKIDPAGNSWSRLPLEDSIYVAYLVGLPHPAVNLGITDAHVLPSAFFGNVLIDAADMADWPAYDRLPRIKKYELANKTDALYADLLTGRITPEAGVPIAEDLWAQREDDDYFQTGNEGGGAENEMIVDYRLGAILKKIGSKVPTVHAWVW